MSATRPSPDARLALHARLASGVLVVGLALLVMMIVVEDEPGGIPVLLVLIGGMGLGFTRYRMRS